MLESLLAVAVQCGVDARVTFWNGASDDEYVRMLSTAAASVSASRAEGFGLPLIEAMSCGVPFIASDIPVFREVGGDAALYFDPDSPEDLADRVRLVEDIEFRRQTVERGHTQAARFSWEQSAAALLDLMTRLMTPVDSTQGATER